MVVNKRKKNRKLRGSRTYGWGSPKKHRGKGSRGGVGKSGMGKRGQHKMSLLNALGIKNLGSHGFVRPRQEAFRERAINLRTIDANINKWLEKKLAAEEKGIISLDVSKIGFDKVLGSGTVSRKMSIRAEKFSAGAKEKIEAAGGRVEEALRQNVSRKSDAEEGGITGEAKEESPKEAQKAEAKTAAKESKKPRKAPKEKKAAA